MQPLPATLPAVQTTDAVYSKQRNCPDSQSGCFRKYTVTVAKYLGWMGVGATGCATILGSVSAPLFYALRKSTASCAAVGAVGGAACGAIGGAALSGISLPVFLKIQSILRRELIKEQQSEQGVDICRFRDRAVSRTNVVLLLKYIVAQIAAGAATCATAGAAGVAVGRAVVGAIGDATGDADCATAGDIGSAAALAAIGCALDGAIFSPILSAVMDGEKIWHKRTKPVIDNKNRTQSVPDRQISPFTTRAHEPPPTPIGELAHLKPEPVQSTDAVIDLPQAGLDQARGR